TLIAITFWYARICKRQASVSEVSAASAAEAASATEATVRVQLWLEAQRLIRDGCFYAARGKIMGQERPLRAAEWAGPLPSEATEEDARLVCRDMDQVACLIKLGRFPRELGASQWDDIFLKTWIVVKLLVLRERKERGPGEKWCAFGELGEKALRD